MNAEACGRNERGGGNLGAPAIGMSHSDSFRPNRERAAALAGRMRDRLAASFAHVLDAVLPHLPAELPIDAAAVRSAIARIASARQCPPALYMLYRRCVRATAQGDLGTLREGFARLSRSPCALPPGLRLRNWGDLSFTPEELADYRWIFTEDHGDLAIRVDRAPEATYELACAALGRAHAALRHADPELADEIETLIGEIVFAVDAGGSAAPFDGATSFFAHGALLLNAAEHASAPEALAGLVHEAAHCWLFAETEGAPLVENDPALRYRSPLRADPRPMNGIYHATIVSARMALALDAVLDRGGFAGADEAEAERLRETSRKAFAAGRDVVRAHGEMIPLARRILDDAEAAMATLSFHPTDRRPPAGAAFPSLPGEAGSQGLPA